MEYNYNTKFAVGDAVLMIAGCGKHAYFYPCVYEIARVEIEQGAKGRIVVRYRLRSLGGDENPGQCMIEYPGNLTLATEESIRKACEDHAAALLGELARRRG